MPYVSSRLVAARNARKCRVLSWPTQLLIQTWKRGYVRCCLGRRGFEGGIYAVVIMFSYTVLAYLQFENLGLVSFVVSVNKVGR